MIEHLADTPPTCLPLNSDSIWCLSSIDIDRDTHFILRTGLTRWYYECCCGKWCFNSDILMFGLNVLISSEHNLYYCMYIHMYKMTSDTHTLTLLLFIPVVVQYSNTLWQSHLNQLILQHSHHHEYPLSQHKYQQLYIHLSYNARLLPVSYNIHIHKYMYKCKTSAGFCLHWDCFFVR